MFSRRVSLAVFAFGMFAGVTATQNCVVRNVEIRPLDGEPLVLPPVRQAPAAEPEDFERSEFVSR